MSTRGHCDRCLRYGTVTPLARWDGSELAYCAACWPKVQHMGGKQAAGSESAGLADAEAAKGLGRDTEGGR